MEGQASIRAAVAFGANHVSVRNRRERLWEFMNSLTINVFGVRERTFHKAMEIGVGRFWRGLNEVMGLKFCLFRP